jgi:hypothetical protein
VLSLLIKDTILFAGTNGSGIFLSIDSGKSWKQQNSGLTNMEVMTFDTIGTNLLAGTYGGGIFLSSDNGNSWNVKDTGLTNLYITSIKTNGNYIFAGTWGGGIYLSSDNGNTWVVKNLGLTNLFITSFIINGNYIYAGTNGGIFKAKLSDFVPVNVSENNKKINYLIYPNPAGNFLIVHNDNMYEKEISIYDMLGNKLLSVRAESSETRLDIESLSTGVYIIRIGEQTKIFVKE